MDAIAIETRDWLLREWSENLCLILESMADQRPQASIDPDAPVAPLGEAVLIWEQSFSVWDKPAIWVAVSRHAALDLGRRTLAAAGVYSVEDAECLSTFLEILGQSLSALGGAMGEKWQAPADATNGKEVRQAPEGLDWVAIHLEFADGRLDPIWFAAPAAFLARLAARPVLEASPSGPAPVESSARSPETALPSGSKTFNLLLDVALPVSISFGRTMLPIKEVLRLNSGSIVELDRAINEPVEVIVNNCVIARGEVVVIEGNYGVRIQEIASRYDRLRTGAAASQIQRGVPA